MGHCQGRDVYPRAVEDRSHFYDYSANRPEKSWSTSSPSEKIAPRIAKAGPSSDISATTLPQLLTSAARMKGEKAVLKAEQQTANCSPEHLPQPEEWLVWTFQDLLIDARNAAKGFTALGFQKFDSVIVWGSNSPEWSISAVAAGFAGGKFIGVSATDSAHNVAFKAVHSAASVIVVEDRHSIDKLVKALAVRGDAKCIKAFLAYGFEPLPTEQVAVANCGMVSVLAWKSVLQSGSLQVSDLDIDRTVASTDPGHCAALIYTAGTTGNPKAVMLSHDNIIYEARTLQTLFTSSCNFLESPEQERILSYLSLAHVASFVIDIAMPLVSVHHPGHMTVFFMRPCDLDAGAIKARLLCVMPTLFYSVPALWEKLAATIRSLGDSGSAAFKEISSWAQKVGLQYAENCQLGGDKSYPIGYSMASAFMHKHMHAELGLHECKFLLSGAAPLPLDTHKFLASWGFHIHELYGMSESTGAVALSTREAHEWGCCGFPLPGVELAAFKIDCKNQRLKTPCPRAPSASDVSEEYQGEVCLRGRNVMMGYMSNSRVDAERAEQIQTKLAETIDNEGWLHSGDRGIVTESGMVKILGRCEDGSIACHRNIQRSES